MNPIRDPTLLARMRATSDLYEAAESLMRQQLKRSFPEEGPSQIERRLVTWLQRRRDD